jgi:hypothetical protein
VATIVGSGLRPCRQPFIRLLMLFFVGNIFPFCSLNATMRVEGVGKVTNIGYCFPIEVGDRCSFLFQLGAILKNIYFLFESLQPNE